MFADRPHFLPRILTSDDGLAPTPGVGNICSCADVAVKNRNIFPDPGGSRLICIVLVAPLSVAAGMKN